jgi:hypothetical protein
MARQISAASLLVILEVTVTDPDLPIVVFSHVQLPVFVLN